MSDPERPRASASSDEPPADEEYARTYAAGYEEGLRSALRELLGHASRGRTNQELRALIQSRLAGLAEEVELKRRSLLAPPRPRPFGDLQRPVRGPPGRPPGSAGADRELPALLPGATVLVREARPSRAVELLRKGASQFPRLVVVSLRPPSLEGIGREPIVISVREPGPSSDRHLSPGEVGGRLRDPTERAGGALVYVDALEFFVSEEGADLSLRFVHWLVEQVGRTGSALVVSYDPRALDPTDASRLERSFGHVLEGTSGLRPAGA